MSEEAGMGSYWNRLLKAALIRAVRTFAQTTVSVLGCSAGIEIASGEVITMQTANWALALSAGAFAAIVSVLMSAAGLPEVKEEQPAIVDSSDIDPAAVGTLEEGLNASEELEGEIDD